MLDKPIPSRGLFIGDRGVSAVAIVLLALIGVLSSSIAAFAQYKQPVDRGASDMPFARPESSLKLPSPGSVEAKLHSQLLAAIDQPDIAASAKLVELDIVADVGPGLLTQIEHLGGSIVNQFPADHSIRARIPLKSVHTLASSSAVKFIQPAAKEIVNQAQGTAGLIEGDVAHKADIAKSTDNVDGSNVRVCVISDSLHDSRTNNTELKDAQDSHDMSSVDILTGQEGTGTGEGLAMLEIVHKLAPSATLAFATSNGGDSQMEANIRGLELTYHCKVIVDDIDIPDEPVFQDGVISKAINDVTAKGVLYVTSATNVGNAKHGSSGAWEGDFSDGGADSRFAALGDVRVHQFAPGQNYAKVTYATPKVGLYWDDPWSTASNAPNTYGLVVYDAQDKIIAGAVVAYFPYEFLNFSNYSRTIGGKTVIGLIPGDKIYVIKMNKPGLNSGPSDPRFLHLDTFEGKIDVGKDGATHGHSAAKNAMTVASIAIRKSAAGVTQPFAAGPGQTVDFWSADGPRRIFYKPDGAEYTPGNYLAASDGGLVLQKPDITAADCVKTTFPVSTPNLPTDLNPFCGTSAAAAHLAGIAALVFSVRSTMTASQVRLAILSSAIDIENPDWDRQSGYGVAMADRAVEIAQSMNQQFLDVWSQFDLDGRIAMFAADPAYQCTLLLDNAGEIRMISRYSGRNVLQMFGLRSSCDAPLRWSNFYDAPKGLSRGLLTCVVGASLSAFDLTCRTPRGPRVVPPQWGLMSGTLPTVFGNISNSPPPLPSRN